jgi:glutathione S-transferase
MIFELFYWPQIQGRGELVRILFEDQGVDYADVCRTPDGMDRLNRILHGEDSPLMPFAPPFLRADELWISHTAAIATFVAEKLGFEPPFEQEKLTARTLALTLADLVTEAHDTHHPISVDLTYDKQTEPARLRAAAFRDRRMPKFLRYFERTIVRNDRHGGGGVLVGSEITYVDLMAFQVIEGLKHAFPRAFERIAREVPNLVALHSRISVRPRLAAYLASDRRLPFNDQDIFRHYPELDA